MGFLPSVHLDLFIPIQQLKIDDAELQYLRREDHMQFIKRYSLKNNLILFNVMEQSLDYFKDILDKMIMLDYDIFRISLLMY